MKIDEDHLTLLRAMAELMQVDDNYGLVPVFDAKRPFGNSGSRALVDAAELIDCDLDVDDADSRYGIENKLRECTAVLRKILNGDLSGFVGQKVE